MSDPSPSPSSPQQVHYTLHKETLRSIIATDHFSDSVPPALVDTWLEALHPASSTPLPPGIKGLYGGDLRSSIPIELAHDSYKYIIHETSDIDKVEEYAERMLVSLGLLNLDALGKRDATLASLALWHKALALVRVRDREEELRMCVARFATVRPRSRLGEGKCPTPERLRERLKEVAGILGRRGVVEMLEVMGMEGSEVGVDGR